MKQTVVAFDLDGTLTCCDTAYLFLVYHYGSLKLVSKGLKLIPSFLSYLTGAISKKEIKEKILSCYLKGKNEQFFQEEGLKFFKNGWFFRKRIVAKLLKHKEEGASIILVSANFYPLLVNLKQILPFDHILATAVEFDKEGRITGRILGENCWGKDKLKRLLAIIDRPNVELIAYGDSAGDKELLESADQAHWI